MQAVAAHMDLSPTFVNLARLVSNFSDFSVCFAESKKEILNLENQIQDFFFYSSISNLI